MHSTIHHPHYGEIEPSGEYWYADVRTGESVSETDIMFGGFYTVEYRAYVVLPLREVLVGPEPRESWLEPLATHTDGKVCFEATIGKDCPEHHRYV